MSAQARLIELFEFSSPSDDKLISECTEICRIYNISPQDLKYKWEAIEYKHGRPGASRFTMDSVIAIQAAMQRELAANNTSKASANAKSTIATRAKTFPQKMKANMSTPIKPVKQEQKHEQASFSAAAVAFSRIDGDGGPSKRNYKYMYETISERSEALDDMLDDFSAIVKEHYNVPDFGDPAASTDEPTVIVGRIVVDAEAASTSDVKLNDSILAIESSRAMGSGVRVPLRFAEEVRVRGCAQGAGGIGVFPGAIVALQGKNGGGGWFLVEEILSLPPLQPASKSTRPASFSVAAAYGPYTPDADMKYKPWKTLLSQLNTEKPKVILLGGPFVDINHPRLQDGGGDQSINELFEEQFIEPLHEFLASFPDSIVIIVPSVQDAVSDHAVFPQAQLSNRFSNHSRLHMLPNPCHFSINGVVFATCTADVFFHLRKEECFKRGTEISPTHCSESSTDAMTKLTTHLFQQRSFYPVFPVPIDHSREINLSVRHWQDMRFDQPSGVAPDIVIIPSRLRHFSKSVYGATVVNPGQLCKNNYAWLQFTSEQPCEVIFKRLEA